MNADRHSRDCSICRHPERDAIETELINWQTVTKIAKRFRVARSSLYRHVAALSLLEKRDRNIRGALVRIIEKATTVHVTAAAVVSACMVLAKLDDDQRLVDRVQISTNSSDFDRMTRAELEAYAQTGVLPPWFARDGRPAN